MPRILTLPEVAEYLKLSRSNIYHMTSARAIPHYKIGQRILFSEPEVEQWLAARRVAPLARCANKGGGG